MAALTAATKKTLQIQCQTDCNTFPPVAIREIAAASQDTLAVVVFESKTVNGFACLCISKEVLLRLGEKMFGEPLSIVSPEIADLATELMNIIYGQVKTELNRLNLPMAIPRLLAAPELEEILKPELWSIPFQTDRGNFQIVLSLTSNEKE